MKNLFEVVKRNRRAIINSTLLIGGTIVGLVINNTLDQKENEVFEDYGEEVEFTPEDMDEVIIDIKPEEEK